MPWTPPPRTLLSNTTVKFVQFPFKSTGKLTKSNTKGPPALGVAGRVKLALKPPLGPGPLILTIVSADAEDALANKAMKAKARTKPRAVNFMASLSRDLLSRFSVSLTAAATTKYQFTLL